MFYIGIDICSKEDGVSNLRASAYYKALRGFIARRRHIEQQRTPLY